jgi:hypothetical protein
MSIAQRHHLGVRPAGLLGEAFAHHFTGTGKQDTAYTRVGVAQAECKCRQFVGAGEGCIGVHGWLAEAVRS